MRWHGPECVLFLLQSVLFTRFFILDGGCLYLYRWRASSAPEPTGWVYPLVVRSRHRAASGEHRSTWAQLLHSYGRPERRQVHHQPIRNLKRDFSKHTFKIRTFFKFLPELKPHLAVSKYGIQLKIQSLIGSNLDWTIDNLSITAFCEKDCGNFSKRSSPDASVCWLWFPSVFSV